MNRDGCRNCKHMEYTGAANIMRCKIDSEMVDPYDECNNYKLSDANVLNSVPGNKK
jgi:hypothetical protein